MGLKIDIRKRAVFALWMFTALFVGSLFGVSAQAETPEAVVGAFLDAWNESDVATMYSYLSTQSKEFYAEQVFELRYQLANEAMRFDGLTYTINESKVQGITAAVKYDVTIKSSEFGEITDAGRTMRLVNNNGVWGIAWSSMDIFDALTSDSTITAAGRLPERANIYDRNGQPIAQRGLVTAIYAARQDMGNEEDCIQLMARITRRPAVAFQTYFLEWAPETIFFLEELNNDIYERFRDQLTTTCGVSLTTNRETRVYYGNNAMTHTAGYVGPITAEQEARYRQLGYNSSDLVGQTAVEQEYERYLAGVPDRVLRITEPGGTVLRELGSSTGSNPVSLQLTVDRELQLAVAQAMADAYDYAYPNWGSPQISGAGAAVVLDVNSGAILAMVSYPLLDPHLFDRDSANPRRATLLGQVVADSRDPLANHAIQNQFTPGSVFKVISAIAILNEGLTRADEIFFCDLYWNGEDFGDTQGERRDWRVADGLEAAGEITPPEAIMSSCNPFFWQYGAILYREEGRDALVNYARDLGLGQDYDLFETMPEASGLLNPPTSVPAAVNEAVGQGDVSLPPLQMAVATAAIANGGTVYEPYLVRQIGGFDETEVVETFEPVVMNELELQPGVLEAVRFGMCGATTNQDLGTAIRVFNNQPYSVCGKTGTAQTGLYPNAWFIAYAPAENPQIAIAVMVSQSLEGSQIAAPITRRILDYYFNVNEVEPYPEWWAEGPYVPLSLDSGG